jgi:hypothetical protein
MAFANIQSIFVTSKVTLVALKSSFFFYQKNWRTHKPPGYLPNKPKPFGPLTNH